MNMQLTNLTTNFLHCLPFFLCVCPIVGLSVCLFVWLCVSVYLCVYLPVCVFVCINVCFSVCPCVRLLDNLFVCSSSVFLYFFFLCLSLSFYFCFSLFLYTSSYLDQLLLNQLDGCNHYYSQTSRLVLILIAKFLVPNLYCIFNK